MSVDYIPSKESVLGPWATNLSTLITAAPGAYGLMASDALTIASVTSAFTASLALVMNPATKTRATVIDKNAKKSAMLGTIRPYCTMIKNNQGVSNEAKVALGLHVNDTTRTKVPTPTTEPVISVSTSAPLQQSLRFADVTTPDRKSKPAGIQTLVLMVAVGDAPPADPSTLPLKALVTKQNFIVEFEPADRLKTAYYFGRWATAGGLMGPWSQVAQQLIT